MKIYLLKRNSKVSKKSESEGRIKKASLYLMYHYGHGKKRDYEFLDLYIFEKPKSQIEKDHNKQTWQLAEAIKARKVLDAQSTSHGFINSAKSQVCFLDYFKSLVDRKYDSIGNHGNWLSTYQHLKDFVGKKSITLERVDEKFLEMFKEYLLACKTRKGLRECSLNRNTALSYFNKVRTAIKEAYNTKLIKDNPVTRVKCIKGQLAHREYLTVEELQKLRFQKCDDPLLAKAFLFGAVTGLRFSDIKGLRWTDIQFCDQNGYSIKYTQKKTKQPEILPIAEHTLKLLGDRNPGDDKVFENLQYSAYKNKMLQKWISEAGINKKISFHCSRHTHAVLQLSVGTDIFTVSKLLGHQNIKTTMHYLHIIDQHKITAAGKVPSLIAL